jgi:predicted SAM-dependent methyltransferase
MRLHIGGEEAKAGWSILNAQPGPNVDFVGDCCDLTRFGDGSVEEIYASHVLEHLGHADFPRALAEIHRVLRAGGRALISVPDFEMLCQLYLDPANSAQDRLQIMRMAFGGQTDAWDFHRIGLCFEVMAAYLLKARFSRVQRVASFGLFDDSSETTFREMPISLNVIAHK